MDASNKLSSSINPVKAPQKGASILAGAIDVYEGIAKSSLQWPDFLIIPTLIIADTKAQIGIRLIDGFVYGIVYWYTKMKLERCIVSNKTIAGLLLMSERAVQQSLARLKKMEYIAVVYTKDNHRQEIIPLLTMNKRSYPPEQMFTPPRTSVHHNKNTNKRIFNSNVILEDETFKKAQQRIAEGGRYSHLLDELDNRYPTWKYAAEWELARKQLWSKNA